VPSESLCLDTSIAASQAARIGTRSKAWQAGRYTSRKNLGRRNVELNDRSCVHTSGGMLGSSCRTLRQVCRAESLSPVSFAKLHAVPSVNYISSNRPVSAAMVWSER
jgi:hypothetical protein